MPSSITLGELKAQVLDRADMSGSGFIDDGRLADYINYELGRLYDQLITTYEDYFVKSTTITLVNGTEAYDLADDFYKLLKVFAKQGNRRWRLKKFTMEELDYLDADYAPGGHQDRYLRHRLLGKQIYFAPAPISGGTVEYFYVPELATLKEDYEKITVHIPCTWEDAVVTGAAIRCLAKEESDTSQLEREYARHIERIRDAGAERDLGEPHRISDVDARFSWRYGWR